MTLDNLRVLVVEDEPLQAMAHQDILTDAGALVIGPFASQRDAMAALKHEVCDVAVLDFALGSETALDLQRRLDELGVPYIVVTGYPKVLVRNSQHQTIIAKPVAADLLCSLVAAKARHQPAGQN